MLPLTSTMILTLLVMIKTLHRTSVDKFKKLRCRAKGSFQEILTTTSVPPFLLVHARMLNLTLKTSNSLCYLAEGHSAKCTLQILLRLTKCMRLKRSAKMSLLSTTNCRILNQKKTFSFCVIIPFQQEWTTCSNQTRAFIL